VLDGLTTAELAREAYGVVLAGPSLEVDTAATEELRARKRSR
jgi:hypothetical protein